MQRFKAPIERFNSDLWHFHVKVDPEIVDHYKSQKVKRLIAHIGEITFHCALMPEGNGIYFININKEIRKQLKLEEGDVVEVKLEEDNSKYGMPISEEMEELLKQDEQGNHYFHQLTPGKQRNLIHMVNTMKTSNKRLEKALMIFNYLKEGEGKLDFKELNIYFKENRI